MGCDIHAYAESRRPGWTNWIADGYQDFATEGEGDETYLTMPDVGVDRNYGLFGLLADVRRDVSGITEHFPVRGFPSDASSEVAQIYKGWACDAHTPNWITLGEMRKKLAELLIAPSTDAPLLMQRLAEFLTSCNWPIGADGDAHRVVFWFDN